MITKEKKDKSMNTVQAYAMDIVPIYNVTIYPHKGESARFKVWGKMGGMVGDYYHGAPWQPNLAMLVALTPYRLRKTLDRAGVLWYNEHDKAWSAKLYSTKGKYLGKVFAKLEGE